MNIFEIKPSTAWPGSSRQRTTNTHQTSPIVFKTLGILFIKLLPVKKNEE